MDQVKEELLQEIEGVVNLFFGLQFDPAIPKHVKDALRVKAEALGAVLEKHLD